MKRLAIALPLLALVSITERPAHAEHIERAIPNRPAPALTIRTYTVRQGDEPSPATLVLASSLLAEAGITSRWTSCGAAVADTTCSLPLSSAELAMRLVHDPADHTGRGLLPMGTSFVDTARRTGTLATLYLDRIASLSTAAGTAADVILARAIAHEAAHLVLGTNEHGSVGLMRAIWSLEMLRHTPASEWVFTASEGQRMREALAGRLGPVEPDPPAPQTRPAH